MGGGGEGRRSHFTRAQPRMLWGKESLPQLFLAVAGTTWHFARFVSVLMKRESYCMLEFRQRESSETFGIVAQCTINVPHYNSS